MVTRTLTLDLEVLCKGRHEATFQASGDPGDADWLQRRLREWLRGHKWQESRWGEFELTAREAGTWTLLGTVRA
jgi:hypothetical protein